MGGFGHGGGRGFGHRSGRVGRSRGFGRGHYRGARQGGRRPRFGMNRRVYRERHTERWESARHRHIHYVHSGHYSYGRHRYGSPYYRRHHYARWRTTHGHYYVEENIHADNYHYDTFRKQLPPDGLNFAFFPLVPRMNKPVTRPTGVDWNNIETRIVAAWNNTGCVSTDFCCLLPVIGWIYWCSERDDAVLDKALDQVGAVCTDLNLFYAQQGITIQFIYEDPIFYGFVVEVNPVDGSGQPNPLWQGEMPTLSDAEVGAIVINQQIERGDAIDGETYARNMFAAEQAIEQRSFQMDMMSAVAHAIPVLERLVGIHEVFVPYFEGARMQLHSIAQQLHANSETALERARVDWQEWRTHIDMRNWPFEEVNRLNALEDEASKYNKQSDPALVDSYVMRLVAEFCMASALPVPQTSEFPRTARGERKMQEYAAPAHPVIPAQPVLCGNCGTARKQEMDLFCRECGTKHETQAPPPSAPPLV